jgi:hypothetical protein
LKDRRDPRTRGQEAGRKERLCERRRYFGIRQNDIQLSEWYLTRWIMASQSYLVMRHD